MYSKTIGKFSAASTHDKSRRTEKHSEKEHFEKRKKSAKRNELIIRVAVTPGCPKG